MNDIYVLSQVKEIKLFNKIQGFKCVINIINDDNFKILIIRELKLIKERDI